MAPSPGTSQASLRLWDDRVTSQARLRFSGPADSHLFSLAPHQTGHNEDVGIWPWLWDNILQVWVGMWDTSFLVATTVAGVSWTQCLVQSWKRLNSAGKEEGIRRSISDQQATQRAACALRGTQGLMHELASRRLSSLLCPQKHSEEGLRETRYWNFVSLSLECVMRNARVTSHSRIGTTFVLQGTRTLNTRGLCRGAWASQIRRAFHSPAFSKHTHYSGPSLISFSGGRLSWPSRKNQSHHPYCFSGL